MTCIILVGLSWLFLMKSITINSNDQVWQHKVSIKKYVCCKFSIFVLLNQLLLISLKHFCCCHGWSKFTVALRYARKFLLWDNCINTPMIWKKQKLAKQHPHTAVGSIILMVFLIILTHPRGEEERPKNPHTKYRALILRVCPTPEGKRHWTLGTSCLYIILFWGVFTWAKIMFFLILEACPICHLLFLLAVSIGIIISMLLSKLLSAVLLFYDIALSLE